MNSGQIVKSKKHNRFTIIPNEMIQDSELSLKAKGLLCYLLSLPDDWVIYKGQLQNNCVEGRDAISSAFKELQKKGYIVSVRLMNSDGTFNGYSHVVYDLAQKEGAEKPNTENPKTDKPTSDKPPLQNTNPTNDLPDKETKERAFTFFWDLYDKKIDKAKAKKIFDKVPKSEYKPIYNHILNYKQAEPNKQYRKYFSTYLNSRMWEDEELPRSSSIQDNYQPTKTVLL